MTQKIKIIKCKRCIFCIPLERQSVVGEPKIEKIGKCVKKNKLINREQEICVDYGTKFE